MGNCIFSLQCFVEEDDGIPPCCRYEICPLSHENRWFNNNSYIRRLGDVGYGYFDENRKLYLGIASIVTAIALVMTIYGCMAMSTNSSIVQRTYWAAGSGKNETSGEYFAMYIGLRSVEYINCPFQPGYEVYGQQCTIRSIKWATTECSSNPMVTDACEVCAATAISLWITTVMSCFSLVMSLLGALTRMRVTADAPVQKLLGMASESWGAITLAYALYTFKVDCFSSLSEVVDNYPDVQSKFWMGPGWICYVVCCSSGVVRAVVHWLTPLPGKGRGLGKIFNMCYCCYCCHWCCPTINTKTIPVKPKSTELPQQHLPPLLL